MQRRVEADIIHAIVSTQYPRTRNYNPQKAPKHHRDLQYLTYEFVSLRASIKKLPKHGYSPRIAIKDLIPENQRIEDYQHMLYQAQTNISQKGRSLKPVKSQFTFVTVELTDEELDAYAKWSAKHQNDFENVLQAVLLDEVKMSVTLTDDVYYATLVGQKEGKYDNMAVSARSDTLSDAMLLVCYKHIEVLAGKWIARKGKRGSRG